jgi:hypothetical protein
LLKFVNSFLVHKMFIYLYKITTNKNTKIMRTITTEQVTRIEKEIKNTKNLLAAEMKISEDLRYMEMVEFYNNHILKLENMLVTKQW